MTDLTGARNQRPRLRSGSAGRYVALCGDAVWAVALACPPGPRCPVCVAARTPDPASERHCHRQHQPGVWAWLNLVRGRHHRVAGAAGVAPDAD